MRRAAGGDGKCSPGKARRVRRRRGKRRVAMGTGSVVMEWGNVAAVGLMVIPRGPGVSVVQGSTDVRARARGVCRFQGSWGIVSLMIIPRESRGLGGPQVSLLEPGGSQGSGLQGSWGSRDHKVPLPGPRGAGVLGVMGLMIILRGLRGPWHHFQGQDIQRDQRSKSLGGPRVFRGVHTYFPESRMSHTKFQTHMDFSHTRDLVLRHW